MSQQTSAALHLSPGAEEEERRRQEEEGWQFKVSEGFPSLCGCSQLVPRSLSVSRSLLPPRSVLLWAAEGESSANT